MSDRCRTNNIAVTGLWRLRPPRIGCLLIRPGSDSIPPVLWANHVYIFGQMGPRSRHHIFRDRLPHVAFHKMRGS